MATRGRTPKQASIPSAPPASQDIADAVVMLLVARDLAAIGSDYPDAVPKAEFKAWTASVDASIAFNLGRPGFEAVAKVQSHPMLKKMANPERYSSLMIATLLLHPLMAVSATDSDVVADLAIKAKEACEAQASPRAQTHLQRLAEVMVVACQCPTGKANKEFAEPARHVQMLHRYWTLAGSLVSLQTQFELSVQPHPLLNLIENLRERIRLCFERLSGLPDSKQVARTCDALIGMLTEGDVGDLSAIPEVTVEKHQQVERFIAKAALTFKRPDYGVTSAEAYFIKQAGKLIDEYGESVRRAWKGALGSPKRTDTSKQAARARNATMPDPVSPALSEREEKVGSLLERLVAVDDGVLLLGPKLKSLAARGDKATSHLLRSAVQTQLRQWTDPIHADLRAAERASVGVGEDLSGLISEPSAWEVETRVAIRSLMSQLTGLVGSNGAESAESLVLGAAFELFHRGQRLQAAYEALVGPAKGPTATAARAPRGGASSEGAAQILVIGKPGEPCFVKGKEMPPLSEAQRAVILALIDAGEKGMTKDAIEHVRAGARGVLEGLRKQNPVWAELLPRPGKSGVGYRIMQ